MTQLLAFLRSPRAHRAAVDAATRAEAAAWLAPLTSPALTRAGTHPYPVESRRA